jgi:hypothetical protein
MPIGIGDIVINPSCPAWGLGIVTEITGANAIVQFERRAGPVRIRVDRLEALGPEQVESWQHDQESTALSLAAKPECRRDHTQYPEQIIVCYECHAVLRPRPLGGDYEVFVDEPMESIYHYCRRYHPDHIAFVQIGYFWNVFERHADACNKLFDCEIGPFGGLRMSGLPVDARAFEQKLVEMNQPHLFVAQLGPGRPGERMLRCITRFWP